MLNNKLVFNYLLDLTKKDIDRFERATIIQQHLLDENISIRELGRQLKIPKSTLEDWLLFKRLSQEEYDKLIADGINPTTIYRKLRATKTQPSFNINLIDEVLQSTLQSLNKIVLKSNQKIRTKQSNDLIAKIRNTLNRIEMRLERNIKT